MGWLCKALPVNYNKTERLNFAINDKENITLRFTTDR